MGAVQIGKDMPKFAQKQKRTQISQRVSHGRPGRAMPRPAYAENLLLAQQQALGNPAVQRLAESCTVFPSRCPFGGARHTCPARVQAKLRIGEPGDKHEQEADRVAEQVMRTPEKVRLQKGGEEGTGDICHGGISVGGRVLRGRTIPNFTFPYRLEGERCRRAVGCRGCRPVNCVRCTGTLVVRYISSPRVRLPRVPRGLRPCQRRIVRAAIDNILAPHERQHVAALNTYNGTTRRPYGITGCRSVLTARLRRMVNSEERPRRAAAQARSDALDPFNPTINIDCRD